MMAGIGTSVARSAAASAALAALAFVAPLPLAGQYSVEDVLSYSFASGLVAAPTGERIAWIENVEGTRNVWVAEGPDWTGRALTSYEGDDGQELASLAFTPDGSSVLYVAMPAR
jgi:hypothetical protein